MGTCPLSIPNQPLLLPLQLCPPFIPFHPPSFLPSFPSLFFLSGLTAWQGGDRLGPSTVRWNHSMVSGPLGAPEHHHLRLHTLHHHLYIYPPHSITSFDTPKACCGCLCLWAPGACSLYTVRGCKSGSITARTRTGSFSLSLSLCVNSIQSSLSLAVALSNTAANTKHPGIADSKLAPGLKEKKQQQQHTQTQTQTLTHRQCTTIEY